MVMTTKKAISLSSTFFCVTIAITGCASENKKGPCTVTTNTPCSVNGIVGLTICVNGTEYCNPGALITGAGTTGASAMGGATGQMSTTPITTSSAGRGGSTPKTTGAAGGAKAETGAAGRGGAAGAATGAAGSTTPLATGGTDPVLPKPKGTCPKMAGTPGTNLTFSTGDVQIWAGPAGTKGPMLLYWFATASSSVEALTGAATAISEVQKSGGVVASFVKSNGQGANTGDAVWYTGDLDQADEVVACAGQEGIIEPKFIASSGYSAGGLQCGATVRLRNSYLASAYCMSGGSAMGEMLGPYQTAPIPNVIAAHGGAGKDTFIMDFATGSAALCNEITTRGALCVNCDDGGDHLTNFATRCAAMHPVGWRFIKEHPYGTKSPYLNGTLPSYFPEYCTIGNPPATTTTSN
jgi:hypothetical protein